MFRIITCVIILILASCSDAPNKEERLISVSIPPLQYLVDEISGGDFSTALIVPSGASPETYEPTVRQINVLSASRLYFQTGLIDFERGLEQGIRDNANKTGIVTLSEGMKLLEGECGHVYEADGLHPPHGVDPHIWLSPARLRSMAAAIGKALEKTLPDSAPKYRINYKNLILRIDSVESHIRYSINELNDRSIFIYHPSLTYFCDDYGLRQVAVEQEGKEPSVSRMKTIVAAIREHDARILFYQKQLHTHTVEALVRETGVRAVSFDPLAYNVLDNLMRLADEISSQPVNNE